MSYRSVRFGHLCLAWAGDVSGVLALTGRKATFYGVSWRWIAFGFWVIK